MKFLSDHFDFSSRGLSRVVLIVIVGTLLCIAVPVTIDLSITEFSSPADLHTSLRNDVLIPLALAVPLLFVMSYSLRKAALAHAELQKVASTDGLTAVLNRGAFTMLVDAYLAEVAKEKAGASGALLIVDADHFKSINDRFGHDSGDEALKLIATSIKGLLRGSDLVGRIGGEEFGVFLPGLDPTQAESVAERIRLTIRSASFVPDGKLQRLSVSVGGAVFDRSMPFSDVYRAADQQLYRAKRDGRNRAYVVPMPPPAVLRAEQILH